MTSKTKRTKYLLTLYIAGLTPAARAALANLKTLCQEYVGQECYEVEIVDINKNPQAAEDELILATPTVIKRLPPPIRRMVGDLSGRDMVIAGLDLKQT